MSGLGGFGGMGAGLGGANSSQQQEQMRLMEMMQEMQVADSLRMYNELVQRCFGHCVDSFRSRKLDGKEVRVCFFSFFFFFIFFSQHTNLKYVIFLAGILGLHFSDL